MRVTRDDAVVWWRSLRTVPSTTCSCVLTADITSRACQYHETDVESRVSAMESWISAMRSVREIDDL